MLRENIIKNAKEILGEAPILGEEPKAVISPDGTRDTYFDPTEPYEMTDAEREQFRQAANNALRAVNKIFRDVE